MENEVRYYLKQIKRAISEPAEGEDRKPFVPQYFVTACKLPTGAIELAVNTQNIPAKIDYILEAYNEDMELKTNTEVKIENILVV